jgi:hypothetical protein
LPAVPAVGVRVWLLTTLFLLSLPHQFRIGSSPDLLKGDYRIIADALELVKSGFAGSFYNDFVPSGS